MVFSILELHDGMEKIPLDLDIPKSLDPRKLVGNEIGLGDKIKAMNPSVVIMCD